jgi:hypothetical protein
MLDLVLTFLVGILVGAVLTVLGAIGVFRYKLSTRSPPTEPENEEAIRSILEDRDDA